MTEETTATVQELSAEDLKDPAKVTAAAEALEAENKAAKAEPTQEEKVLHDQLGRLEKAKAAKAKRLAEASGNEAAPTNQVTLSELDVDNRVFAKVKNLSQEQTDVLNKYKDLPGNEGKSFEDMYSSVGVKAEMDAIQAGLDAEAEIDANANEGQLRATNNDISEKYKKSGKEPKTDYEMKIVAERQLSEEGYREH